MNIGHMARWTNKRRANLWPIGNKLEPIKKAGFLTLEMDQ